MGSGGWCAAALLLLLVPRAGGQVDVPCAALVNWLGCDAPLPGGAGGAATVREACGPDCFSGSRCAPGAEPVAANATANVSAWCRDCPAGMYSQQGTSCESCPAGKYQDSNGADVCFDCPVGQYQSRNGQTECTQCPAHASTCKLVVHPTFGGVQERCASGTTSADACTCQPGFMESAPGVCEECPFGGVCCLCKETAGCYDSAYGTCDFDALMRNFKDFGESCPKCFSGSSFALPRPGYEYDALVAADSGRSASVSTDDGFVLTATSVANQTGGVLLACNTMAAGRYKDTLQNSFDKQNCLGGPNSTCAEGHSGPLCATCDHHWYLTRQGHCEKCVNAERSRIVVLTIGITVIFLAAPLTWGILYWVVADKDSSQFLIYVRLLIDHLQLLSINSGIRAAWPWELLVIYHASESAGLNLDFLEMECAFGWRYAAKYNWFLMLPVFFFGEILLITGAARLICWYRIRAVQQYVQGMNELAQTEDAAKPLSEQKTRTLVNAFAELDPDQDGFVTIDKLPELGRMCGAPLDTAIDVRNAVCYIDPTGTGRISTEAWASFVAVFMYKLTQRNGAKQQSQDSLGARFATFVCLVFAELHVKTEGMIPLVPETTDDWEKVKDHAIQMFLMLMMTAYITLAKWGISVFDCFEQPNKPGTFNLDEAPYIQCFSSEWYQLSALGGFAILIYVIGLPILITYIFFRNYVRLRMGDMQCLQRYGFLYKPYRSSSPGWEVVILVRKSLLVLVTKLRTQSPYIQGVWSLVVYAFVIVTQSSVAPYRQQRHTNMANYFIIVNALAVFSSLIFTSNIPSESEQAALLHVNLVCMVGGWCYACYAAIIDLYLYLRKNMYVEFALQRNQVDPNIERHYQAVDPSGVIDMSYYDLLVLRARYSHHIKRTLPAETSESDTAGSSNGPKSSQSQPRTTQVVEDQTKVHKRYNDLNRMFADFVRRVDPMAVLPKSHNASGLEEDESTMDEASDDDVDEDNVLRSPLDSPLMLTQYKARAKMLNELYSTEHLTLMVCYYDFVLKNKLIDATGLAEFGASDLAADVIDFLNAFTTDALLHAGGRPWGRATNDTEMPRKSLKLHTADDGDGSESRTSTGGDTHVTKGSDSALLNEVQMAKAMRRGRRFLLNPNKLLGNNLRQFLTDWHIDWLSLDDVLDVLQQEIEDKGKQLQRAIAKPLQAVSEPVINRSREPGADDRAPWLASERARMNVGRTRTSVVANPLLEAVNESEEMEVDED